MTQRTIQIDRTLNDSRINRVEAIFEVPVSKVFASDKLNLIAAIRSKNLLEAELRSILVASNLFSPEFILKSIPAIIVDIYYRRTSQIKVHYPGSYNWCWIEESWTKTKSPQINSSLYFLETDMRILAWPLTDDQTKLILLCCIDIALVDESPPNSIFARMTLTGGQALMQILAISDEL